jgi:tryptophanyl-tRNA synthetase
MSKTVILTGLRANNDLHIGNYFGALLPIIDLANKHAGEYQINLFVPDLHSFTTPIDHGKLYDQTLNNLKLFVAAGLPIDHPDVYIYRQSFVPAHSELTWILDCFTSIGEMNRMTQFKDKQSKLGSSADKNVTMGLLNYPVLMAADVLLYGASYVPVGDDQKQHIEFMRDISLRLNSKFGDIFVVPKEVKDQNKFFSFDQGLRIKSLVDPTKKMSKSDDSGSSVIFLNDTPEAASKKILSATTDSIGVINYDITNQPGIANLLQILALLSGTPQSEVNENWQSKTSYSELKQAVAEATSKFLDDFQTKLSAVNDEDIASKLKTSEEAMNNQANQTLEKVQRAVGLRA